MIRPHLLLLPAVLFVFAGCATTRKTTAPGAATVTSAGDIEPARTGSHIRSKKKKAVTVQATQRVGSEDYRQQINDNQLHATGEQIMNARNEGR